MQIYALADTCHTMNDDKPTIRLRYLNVRGLAEPIRLMLHYKQIRFEDIRHDRNEFYASPELKKCKFRAALVSLIIICNIQCVSWAAKFLFFMSTDKSQLLNLAPSCGISLVCSI